MGLLSNKNRKGLFASAAAAAMGVASFLPVSTAFAQSSATTATNIATTTSALGVNNESANKESTKRAAEHVLLDDADNYENSEAEPFKQLLHTMEEDKTEIFFIVSYSNGRSTSQQQKDFIEDHLLSIVTERSDRQVRWVEIEVFDKDRNPQFMKAYENARKRNKMGVNGENIDLGKEGFIPLVEIHFASKDDNGNYGLKHQGGFCLLYNDPSTEIDDNNLHGRLQRILNDNNPDTPNDILSLIAASNEAHNNYLDGNSTRLAGNGPQRALNAYEP